MVTFIQRVILCLMVFSLALAQGEICLICNCVFVNITKIEPKPGDYITFQYKADDVEPFNANSTYEFLSKYFYVDCSSESNVGQIKNLEWPELKVLGVLANFRNSKWKKLESFPETVKKQMTVLSLSQNLITEIEDFELNDFANLKMLNLSQNQIQVIQKGTFSKLTALKILDLSANWLTDVEDWCFYGANIQFLNLSKNGLTHLTLDVFRGMNNLTVLDLSENKFTKLPDKFGESLPMLSWLSVRKNEFRKLPDLPKNLKKFDVSHNNLNDLHLEHLQLHYLDIRNNELVSLTHTNIPELVVLMASHNKMNELSVLQSNRIRILDFSYNNFDKIPDVVHAKKLPFLEELYLDGNPIGNITFPEMNETFPSLKVLSLSNLKIKRILKNSFQGIFPEESYDCSRETGISIDLSENLIKFIDEDAFKTISVCRINLSNNNLKSLPENLLPWFRMSYINLQNNPWQCDCNIQWMLNEFLNFMYKNNPRLLFGMRCSTPSRYKNRMFVYWYNKSSNVFCDSGPSSFYIDLGGDKKIEIWSASAIACVLLGAVILVTGIAIIVLLCTRKSKRKAAPKNSKGPPFYKQISQHQL